MNLMKLKNQDPILKNVRIGTCSWKYDSWIGLIYSNDARKNYLKEYSQHYSTVEIDQWFWSLFLGMNVKLPRSEEAEEYNASVPNNFIFSVKVPNSITLTHYYSKDKNIPLKPNPYFLSNELFLHFLEKISPIEKKLGPLIFQFEYLNKKKIADQETFLDQFGDFIQECPKGYQYAIETRNPNYLNEHYFKFLQSLHLSHVFLQGYYLPPIFELYEKFKNDLTDLTIIRLHGPNRQEIERKTQNRWNNIVEPKDQELNKISQMITELMKRKSEVYINVNNHYEGSAPKTIEKILTLLKKIKLKKNLIFPFVLTILEI